MKILILKQIYTETSEPSLEAQLYVTFVAVREWQRILVQCIGALNVDSVNRGGGMHDDNLGRGGIKF